MFSKGGKSKKLVTSLKDLLNYKQRAFWLSKNYFIITITVIIKLNKHIYYYTKEVL